MFNQIVVAYDGSEPANRALDVAVEIAQHHGSNITLVHAYDSVPHWLGEPNYSQQVEAYIERAEELLDGAVERLEATGITAIEQDILEGPASEAIINAASSRSADLIVMGTRGMGPIRDLLVGSVSERVIARGPCPVLVIR